MKTACPEASDLVFVALKNLRAKEGSDITITAAQEMMVTAAAVLEREAGKPFAVEVLRRLERELRIAA
jgi:hypothetical protein